MRIAKSCIERGHDVKVYTLKWQGDVPKGIHLTLVPVKSASRLKLYQRYSQWVEQALQDEQADLVVGFNKMPHLDVYFAADSCFAEKAETQRGAYYKYTPRYKHFLAYEQAVFGEGSTTEALTLSPLQQQAYEHYYPGCKSRLHPVPRYCGRQESRIN